MDLLSSILLEFNDMWGNIDWNIGSNMESLVEPLAYFFGAVAVQEKSRQRKQTRGANKRRGKKVEYLITLLDGRVNAGKETVITSNLGLSDIAREYGERLASRFADRENSVCLRLCGPDLRMSRRN